VSADLNLKKILAGDYQAVETWCQETWEPLYRYIYYQVQNRHEAEDITQETYLRTIGYLRRHKMAGDNLIGFMKTVAINIIRDRWRRKQRWGINSDLEENLSRPQDNSDMEDIVTQRLEVEAAMQRLSDEHREILDLRILQGYSVRETALRVGKSEAAVRTSQYRALQALAHLIDNS
jgi:RNA polymerase sigma-70 factor (ECF subfamily)